MPDDMEETSKYSMEDYYKVLKWIPRSKVDRQNPCDLTEVIVAGNSVVLPTIYEEFNGVDEVQVFINFNGVSVDVNDILLDFSPLDNGNLSLLQVKCSNTEIDTNNDTILSFKLDNNVKFTDTSRIITGVKSLKINFGSDVYGTIVQKVVMKSYDYTYALSDIDNFLVSGENHVARKISIYSREIPPELNQYIYMAAGAYAWLSRWEYEAKPMKEAKAEADNYATRLLNQVDNAINDYIGAIENQYDHEDLFHATATGVDWGL